MKTLFKLILLSVFLLFASCTIRTPLSEIKNSVVVEKNKNNHNIEVITYHYSSKSKSMIYDFFIYKLCDYEFKQIQVGDSINYSKNIIVNQK